jgi:hypothetical protein
MMHYETLSFYYIFAIILFELRTTNRHMIILEYLLLTCGYILVGSWLYNCVLY